MVDMWGMTRTALATDHPMKNKLPQSRASAVPPASPALTDTDIHQLAAAHPAPRTRVLCIDDSPDTIEVLARLVGGTPDMVSVGTLGSTERITEEVILRRADVAVLDLTMPGFAPLEAIGLLAERAPQCRVIAFSGYDDPGTREAARRAGAWELVSKRGEPTDIIDAIRRVACRQGGREQTR